MTEPENLDQTEVAEPFTSTRSWRRKLSPIAAAVAAATFIVGGASGYALGHSSSSSSSQAGPGGQRPGSGQFPGGPGGSGSSGEGQGLQGQPPVQSGTAQSSNST